MRFRWLVAIVVCAACKRAPSPEDAAPLSKLRLRRTDKVDFKYEQVNPNESGKGINPRDEKGRAILAHGEKCVVQLDSDATEQVDCPPAMDDPAWSSCDGVLSKRPDGKCVCFEWTCMGPDHCKVPTRMSPCPK